MLGFNISNITSSQYRESIDKSSIDIDYKPLSSKCWFYQNYSKKLLTSISQDINYSNTLISTDFSYLQEKSKKIIERKVFNDFENFKDKFENFLRFEDVPIEYVSPIEREFVGFLKYHKIQTLNLVAQWIIDSYHDPKTLLNIVKILGNVAADFIDSQFITNLCILLHHQDIEVKEYVLRVQEKVMSEIFHKVLSNAHLAPQWIDEYRAELVEMYNEENSAEV